MDNQHRKITGYRDLSEDEIAVMNSIKQVGNDVGKLVEAMKLNQSFDQRWVSIGMTDLQKGFMALTRAVAKPESF